MSPLSISFDYHGALVVVETDDEQIVMTHPPDAPAETPASLPSSPLAPGPPVETAALRMVRDMTGLEVQITVEFLTFIQAGTPTGTMLAHGYGARAVGGALLEDGPEGRARAYPVGDLPRIMPIRVANRRVLACYLEQREAD
ncbi:MAG: NUDIX hydrolase [Nocardioidaceae bacterium]